MLRAGRITEAQKRALDGAAAALRHPVRARCRSTSTAVFGRRAPRVLEIGFGNGDTLVELAARSPGIDFIGAEVHPPGVGHCLLEVESRGARERPRHRARRGRSARRT